MKDIYKIKDVLKNFYKKIRKVKGSIYKKGEKVLISSGIVPPEKTE